MSYLTLRNGHAYAGRALGFDPFRSFFTGTGAFSNLEIGRTQDGGFTVEVPVAGYKPEEIEVTLEENVLTVSGKSEKRNFTRSLYVPDEVDGDNVSAKVENGLLTLGLPLQPKAQPKKIAIAHNG